MQLKDEIVGRIRTIPPLSQAARQIIEILSLQDHDPRKLSRIIETDVGLTARVLTIANATPLAYPGPVTTVGAAMGRLGDRVVLGIALDNCTDGLLLKPLPGYNAEQGRLWEHNLLTAIAARAVALTSDCGVNPDEAFTGGILHDVGKAVLSEFLKGAAEEMVREVDSGAVPDYLAAEEEKLGTNHCIIGAAMAKMWNLPSPFPEIIRHHHHPRAADAKYQAILYAVHLGDIIAMMKGAGTGSDALCYKLENGYRETLGMRKDQFPGIMLRVDEEFQKIKDFVSEGSIDADNSHS